MKITTMARVCCRIFAAAWLTTATLAAEPTVKTSYTAYRFTAAENWHTRGSGNAGATQWKAPAWSLDFSQGAAWLGISPNDMSLLGKVDKIRLRGRGTAKGHPLHLFLHTHFMTFHKLIGEFSGEGEQEIVTDGPPGPGWQWFSGENDGKIHGPLRVGEIRLEAAGQKDRCNLELLSLAIDGNCPAQRRCVLVASTQAAAGGSQFRAEIRALSAVGLEGLLQWQFRNWDQQSLGLGDRRIVAPPGAQPLTVDVPLPTVPAGCRFIEAEFSLDLPGQKVPPVQAYWLAPQVPCGDSTLRPESPFGMGIYLGRYRAGSEMEQAARMARDAGVKWSREDFNWSRIEPQKGRFEWAFYDDLLACAKRNGISVYAIVGYWTPWTRPYTDEGVNDYVAFLRKLVEHYKNDIHQWEIWNEPNIFFWQGPRELYATLLTKSYAAIKEIDPKAEVLGLSTAGIDYRFIEQMLALKAPFDVLTIHPYRAVLDDQAFIRDLKRVSDLVKLPDGSRRPVWLTEMGWATHVPHNALGQDFQPNTQRAQAELIARSYLCAIVSGVEPRTFWYDFRNDGDDPLYFEHNMGIIYRDFRPKPAYVAFATVANVLRGKKLAQAVPAADGTLAYRFVATQPGGEKAIALWNPSRDTTAALEVDAAKVTIINAIGESHEQETTAGPDPQKARAIRVRLNRGSPLYLLLE
ncbi:MAG: beta-galactosidase [Thermoguttaceae bacterium]|jgi:hypothetical protein